MSDVYLMPSPFESDRGEKIGRMPRDVPTDALRALGAPESPIKAIRAKCIDCSGGNDAEVRKCVATHCALWPFRMGHSPFHARARSNTVEPA